LRAVVQKNREMDGSQGIPSRPLFVKVSPDASEETLEEIARLAVEHNIGLIATNTTIDHSSVRGRKKDQDGGLSGKPLREKSNATLSRLRNLTKGVIPLIGVGGIFSAKDAYEKIRLGATLVQIYTGWIYEGPTLVADINRGLLTLMERDGFKKIQDAIGTLNS
jgi:dihydroorotate dehydrogenase